MVDGQKFYEKLYIPGIILFQKLMEFQGIIVTSFTL